MRRVYVSLELEGEEEKLEALRGALEPEVLSPPGEKGEAHVEVRGGRLVVEMWSDSIGGARALINSYLYLLASAMNSLEEVERA